MCDNESETSSSEPSGDELKRWLMAETRATEQFLEMYKDFRKVPNYPTHLEVHYDLKPPLQRTKDGSYPNVNKYLDIHFKLLREDLTRNLRRSLHDYRIIITSGDVIPRKIRDVRIYEGVTIGRRSETSLTAFKGKFNAEAVGRIDWEHSKRLIFGSLVCLSSNNFNTFCFATIAGQRIAEELSSGRFELEFIPESMSDEFRYIDPKTKFVMIEAMVYYNAYQYVLNTLKMLKTYNFPFKECIIDIDKRNVINERHSIASKVFDLSIMVWNHNPKYRNVFLRAMNQWPLPQEMGFDVYQYEAFKSAFLRQFVLIQGPPGTGKTFVGLKIVQTLHKNREVWRNERNPNKSQKPIVIICYTNHALDQFLEGIQNFCPRKMLRIGGQSKSELLKKCMLKNIKKLNLRPNKMNRYPDDLLDRIKFIKLELKTIRFKISRLTKKIVSCQTDLLDLEFLEDLKESDDCDLRRGKGPNSLVFHYPDIALNLKCSDLLMNWFNSHLMLDQRYCWFEEQMDYLKRNYSNQLSLAVIKWITSSDYENSFGDSNENSFSLDDVIGFEMDADVEEVNRIKTDRDIDSYSDSEDEFEESTEEITLDTIKTDAKALKQISKRVFRQMTNELKDELSSEEVMDTEEANVLRDLSQLSYTDRWKLYRLWVKIYTDLKKACVEALTRRYDSLAAKHKQLTVEKTFHLIKDFQVIGLTTTGAAIHRELMKLIDPKIVVIEEAAEVLESHVVTALTKNTEHLILIGDHRQLKPSITVYELAAKYKLDVSLFERMINNGMPYRQLKIQYRMRPEMSKLIRPNIYRELHDHESVLFYENVKGMQKNMFFLNHSKSEMTNEERLSKQNPFEAKFIVRLAKHLLYQGYYPKQITILTFYSSQLIEIRKLLRQESIFRTEDPKDRLIATTVDNYQGEENDIVLISFVRSNGQKDIGFLKIPNRICVALSRAKKGLYCVGNFDCLASEGLWTHITDYLRSISAIGPTLELKCENHSRVIAIREVNDFDDRSPCGGCTQSMTDIMDCGHPCPLKYCHCVDGHNNVECNVMVPKTLECGHFVEGLCSETTVCYHPCERILKCGCVCDKKCGEECQTECTAVVGKFISECGHTIELECSQIYDRSFCKTIVTKRFSDCGHEVLIECRDYKSKTCDIICDKLLVCGHQCRGSCHDCNQSRLHIECQKNCKKTLICGHKCSGTCGQNCPPCDYPCESICPHKICSHTCSQPCIRCSQLCSWECPHKKCTKLCYEDCDRDICSNPCRKFLKCGHQCIGLCGELCPSFCLVCNWDQRDQLYGIDGMSSAQIKSSKFFELNVFNSSEVTNCRHTLEFNALITYFAIDYNNQELGKQCPKCQSFITRCQPFNSIIRRHLSDSVEKNRLFFCLIMDNERRQDRLHSRINEIHSYHSRSDYVSDQFNKLLDNLKKETNKSRKSRQNNSTPKILSEYELNIIENIVKVVETLREVLRQMIWIKEVIGRVDRNLESNLVPMFYKRMEKFLQFIAEVFLNTNQQIIDTQNEMKFFKLFVKVLKYSIENSEIETSKPLISKLNAFLTTNGSLSEQTYDEIIDGLPNLSLDDIEIKLQTNDPINVLNN